MHTYVGVCVREMLLVEISFHFFAILNMNLCTNKIVLHIVLGKLNPGIDLRSSYGFAGNLLVLLL